MLSVKVLLLYFSFGDWIKCLLPWDMILYPYLAKYLYQNFPSCPSNKEAVLWASTLWGQMLRKYTFQE
jgi:hypothetical protein